MKATNKKIPLWMLFLAVQLPDIIWDTLILAGIEKARINPSLPSNPLEIYYMPYSHGLVSTVLYSLAVVGVLMLVPNIRRHKAIAWWCGAAVFSHWLLDFLSHRPDLPILGDTSLKIGLGLWNCPVWATVIEVALFLGSAIWYAVSVGGFRRRATWLFWIFVAISVATSCIHSEAIPFTTPYPIAIFALVYYVLSTLTIYFVERNQLRTN
jgi:hypothetical protein